MPIDLKNLNPGVRFYWPEDSDKEEWVELRDLTSVQQRKLLRECGVKPSKEFRVNPETRRMEAIEYYGSDPEVAEKFEALVYDAYIVDWNFETPDGQKIECNKDNKRILIEGHPKFRQWIDSCLEELRLHKGEVEKN